MDKQTLSGFLDENHNLFSVIGVFGALAFAALSFANNIAVAFISFLIFSAFILLLMELRSRFVKKEDAEERLIWFQRLLSLTALIAILYWLLGLRLFDKKLFYEFVGLFVGAYIVAYAAGRLRTSALIDSSYIGQTDLRKKIFGWAFAAFGMVFATLIWWIFYNYLSVIIEPMLWFLWFSLKAKISI